MDSIISRKGIVQLMVQKITTGKMTLTLLHSTGNGGWHIQYQESGRAKYFCQASGFTVERCGWRVHLGVDLKTAFWRPTPGECMFSFYGPCCLQWQVAGGQMWRLLYYFKIHLIVWKVKVMSMSQAFHASVIRDLNTYIVLTPQLVTLKLSLHIYLICGFLHKISHLMY